MKQKIVIFCLVIVFVLVSGIMYISTDSKDIYSYGIKEKESTTDSDVLFSGEQDNLYSESLVEEAGEVLTLDTLNTEIGVYLCGEVLKEGVYYLPTGSRVVDALDMAGGLLLTASTKHVNLARVLVDGEIIYFPTIEEGLQLEAEYSKSEKTEESHLVNINTASKDKLMTLPGIGEAKALAIIDYRTNKKVFESIEDIMKVSGIKDSVFSTIKALICV